MPQLADPELSRTQDESQDTLRLEVEQILAQRLERSNLKRSRPATDASPRTMVSEAAYQPEPPPRRAVVPEPVAAPEPEMSAFAQEFAEDDSPDLTQTFVPIEDSPALDEPPHPMERRKSDRRENERREGERRNMEFLRTELKWSSTPEPEEKRRLLGGGGFKPSRFILLAVAIVSACVAGLLALTNAPAPQAPQPDPVAAVVQPVEIPKTRILIATEAVGAGQQLTGTNLGWQELPTDELMPGYISAEAEPDALAVYDQSIARYPLFPGDPIRPDKLLASGRQSLSATLSSGMRGVSVPVAADAAAGGFIKPDDHVDVVLATDSQGQRITRTVLRDVRVLAINAQLGPSVTGEVPEDPGAKETVFQGMALATLELDPDAAEVLIRAASSGSLTLTLRSSSDAVDAGADEHSGANQIIRLTSSFWNDSYSPAVR